MRLYSVIGHSGEWEDSFDWVAGNYYFNDLEKARNYMVRVQTILNVFQEIREEHNLYSSSFTPLLKLDKNAKSLDEHSYYTLEFREVNIV